MKVTEEVLEGLEAVRQSGLTNMFDRNAVIAIATDMGYYETANWIMENKQQYAEGIFQGFESEE